MILDVRKNRCDCIYVPYDMETGLKMKSVVWVNDKTHTYGIYAPDNINVIEHKAKDKIVIFTNNKTIWINVKEFKNEEEVEEELVEVLE